MERDSYLALEPLLVERLRGLIAEAPTLTVATARDLAGVVDAEARLPALHVLYVGDSVQEAPASGSGAGVVQAEQTWAVIVATRDLRDAGSARVDAGRLITAVLALVQGWQPPDATVGRLRRVTAPGARYTGSGAIYVPLYFRTRVLSRGVRPDDR